MSFTTKSLREFASTIASNTLRSSRFDVNFPVIPSATVENLRDLTLRCDAVDIPGIQILTTNLKTYGGQHPLKIPNSKTFDDIRLQFISSKNSKEMELFENWLSLINDRESNSVAYYDDVKCDFVITVYTETDRDGKPLVDSTLKVGESTEIQKGTGYFGKEFFLSYYIKIINAIPIRIEPISVSWDNEELIRFGVNFSYEKLNFSYNK